MSDEIAARPADLGRVRHLALDMDGTLYRGKRLFDATIPFLDRLRRLGIGYTFLTNNTSLSKADYVEKLRRLGIEAAEAEIGTPADATIAHLRGRLPGVGAIAVLGTPSLVRQFEGAGFEMTWDAPEAVVVGFDTTLSYERLCRAAYWIGLGRPFLATHPDLVCPTDEPTVLVDCGAICACLTAATGRMPVVLGKPDPSMLLELCGRLGLDREEVAMVGDRIYTDMAMARRAGVASVLVLSGEATAEEAASMDRPPDWIVADVGELGERLERSRAGGGAMSGPDNDRGRALASMAEAPFDLLVIGGGIVGSGVARDAASRGLRTLLLERSDFASGTSSRSSRLLHGGLRYLAQGRVGLVREASLEKMRLSRIAPHLCRPLPFLFPVWKGSGWSLWQLSIGVRLYDLLCGGRNLGRSSTLGAAGTLRIAPGLRPEGLKGATRHFDAPHE